MNKNEIVDEFITFITHPTRFKLIFKYKITKII